MTDSIEETMFCRLCLVSTEHYQSLDDGVIDIVEELLQNKVNCFNSKNGHELALEGIRNSIICANCVTKIKNACEFKLTCEDTKVILSHYVGSQEDSKLDLKMIYLVEKEPGKEVHSYEEMKICRTCLNMIETGHYACLLDAIKKNNLEDIFQLYLPELMLTLTESPPLICGKCINNFRSFSEFISTFMNTENKIKRFREEIDLGRQNDLDLEITADSFEDIDDGADEIITENGESNIMKLFEDEHFLLDCYSNTTLLVEENEKRMMKVLIKEDIDLFYKETPDFDSEGDEIEESESDSYQENIDNKSCNSGKNIHQTNYEIFGIDEIQNRTSSLSSIPTEEPPSPEILSPEKWFNNKRSRPKINKTNNYSKSKKKKLHKKNSNEVVKKSKPWSNRKPVKDRKKCRKVYGVEHKEMWCTQCRWKKACTKFVGLGVEPR